MKLAIEQAIRMAKEGQDLHAWVLEDLGKRQISAADALILAEAGLSVPEQNLYYEDADIIYDPEFDEQVWQKEPLKMTWEEKIRLAEEIDHKEEVFMSLNIKNPVVRQWLSDNKEIMAKVLGELVTRIYTAKMEKTAK